MVKDILEFISQSLENGDRVELRGFGSFSLHYRNPRLGRNPKTGDSVKLEAKSVPHFKAGKELKRARRYLLIKLKCSNMPFKLQRLPLFRKVHNFKEML